MSPREMNADHLWALTIPVASTGPKLTPKVTPYGADARAIPGHPRKRKSAMSPLVPWKAPRAVARRRRFYAANARQHPTAEESPFCRWRRVLLSSLQIFGCYPTGQSGDVGAPSLAIVLSWRLYPKSIEL